MVRSGNLFADLPAQSEAELTTILAEEPGARVERIVSTGQASPAGFWYDQDGTEWVILLQGAARLLIEGEEAPRTLQPGDFVEIPAHVRHRVEWTDADRPTVWLAVRWRSRGAKPYPRARPWPRVTDPSTGNRYARGVPEFGTAA